MVPHTAYKNNRNPRNELIIKQGGVKMRNFLKKLRQQNKATEKLLDNINNKETIFEIIKPIIANDLGVKPEKVTPDKLLANDLGADSLDLVKLKVDFEKRFDIFITDEQAEKMKTVGDAIDVIDSLNKSVKDFEKGKDKGFDLDRFNSIIAENPYNI